MSRLFGLGYRPDPTRRRVQKSSRLLLGASPSVPKSASLAQFRAPIMDQGQFGSCTGHGSAQAIYTSYASAGITLGFVPSPDGFYKPTRCIERAMSTPVGQPLPALTDSGAMPADVMTSAARYGIRPIQAPTSDGRYSDVDASNVNTEPNLVDLEESGTQLQTGEYRVDETAADFITQICAAIGNNGHALGIGVFVDTAFMEWNPSKGPLDTPPDQNDPDGGGHWLDLDTFDTSSSGIVALGGANSWSAQWGDKGTYLVTANWLKSAVSDIYIFNPNPITMRKAA